MSRAVLAQPAPTPARSLRAPWVWVVALGTVVAAFALGWSVSSAVHGADHGGITVVRTLHGKISAVDIDGAGICITPAGGAQQCGHAFRTPGAPKLVMGQEVTVSVQRLQLGGGSSQDIWVVTQPSPGL